MDQSSTPTTSTTNLTPAKPMPFWQTAPCPAWCTEAHSDLAAPDDRYHLGGMAAVSMSLEQAENFGGCAPLRLADVRAPRLTAGLLQHVREADPVVELLDERDVYNVRMTLGEAEAFARKMLALVEQARGGGAA